MPRCFIWTYLYFARCCFWWSIFPLSKLNPNVGARLHSELNLLPPNLLNLPSSGSANTHDNSADILPDNAINDPSSVQENPGENGDFVQLPSYTEHETDPPTQSVRGSGGSPSDRAPSNSCSPRGEALAPPPAPQSRQHGETESESSTSPQAMLHHHSSSCKDRLNLAQTPNLIYLRLDRLSLVLFLRQLLHRVPGPDCRLGFANLSTSLMER